MAVSDIFKVSWRTFFNPTAWIGLTELRSSTRVIKDNIKAIFSVTVPEHTETFEEAMQRLQVSESDVQKTAQNFLIYSIIFVILAAFSFATSFYMLFEYKSFWGFILSNLMTLLFLTQVLRFHFWHFQIKHRKLGCTFKEWWRGKPFDEGSRS